MKEKDSDEMIEVEFDEIVKRTENGGILIDFGDRKVWLPEASIDLRDWSNIVGVPRWLAEKKGLV